LTLKTSVQLVIVAWFGSEADWREVIIANAGLLAWSVIEAVVAVLLPSTSLPVVRLVTDTAI